MKLKIYSLAMLYCAFLPALGITQIHNLIQKNIYTYDDLRWGNFICHNSLLYAKTIDGLFVFDISEPIDIELINNIRNDEFLTYRIGVFYPFLISTGFENVGILNIFNPLEPEVVFSRDYEDTNFSGFAFIENDLAYVNDQENQCIRLFDLNDPENQNYITTLFLGDYTPYQIIIENNYMFISVNNGLLIYEILDNNDFLFCSYWDSGHDTAHLIAKKDDRVYLEASATFILEVSDPFNPQLMGEGPTLGTEAIALNGYKYYKVVDDRPRRPSKFYLENVEDPDNVLVCGYVNGSNVNAIATDSSGRYAFVGNSSNNSSLIVYDCAPAMSFPMKNALNGNRFHLITSYVHPDSFNARYYFESLDHLQIAYEDDGSIYIPDLVNTIDPVDLSEAYLVFVDDIDTLKQPFTVIPYDWDGLNPMEYDFVSFIDPETEYHVDANRWSWIGYPFPYPRPLQQALDFMYDEISIIMDDEGGFCIPYLVDTIEELQPGQGYYVFSGFDWDFQYYLPPNVDPWEGFPFDDEDDGLIRAVNDFVSTVQPTGKPYIILVHPDQTLQNLEPASIKVYDGETLVGASEWDEQSDIHPVVCWQGFPEYGLVGFTPGNEIVVKVVDASSRTIGINQHASTSSDVDERGVVVDERGDYVDEHNRSATSEDVAESQVSSVFSVSSVVKPGSFFGEGPYAEVTVSASSTAETSIPDGFVLGTVYPNPFNSTLTVPFTLPAQSEVRFQLYNTLGQLQFERVALYPAGQQRFTIDAGEELVSGVYFLKVQTGNENAVQKVILLR
ncbi:T9SS type A sorting domain-containing protein [bacterium]|nr:T9SS type A sorting domain-containing protein [bacterium]